MRRDRIRPGDDAVSPVVGVVLLVGIAVMLTAAVGVFILGFGPGEPPPEADMQFHQESGDTVTITVTRPAGMTEQEVSVQVDGNPACTSSGTQPWSTSGSIDEAESVTIWGSDGGSGCPTSRSVSSGSTVRVIWESSSGGRSDIVAEYETV